MKKKKMIDKSAISFSFSLDGGAFALFGGVDPKQVVGGHKAIVYFENNSNKLDTWALEGQGVYYGKNHFPMEPKVPAIIDTGTSQIALPTALFLNLKTEWNKHLNGEVVCGDKDVFCHIPKDCNKISKHLKPIGFEMSGFIFWIPASEYLFIGGENKCIFKVHQNKLPGENSNIIIVGGMVLKHFYSVFDYD